MNKKNDSTVLYLSHGAGPMPVLGDGEHDQMNDNLRMIAGTIPKPSAIIMISAHWEADDPTITNGPDPQLIYDYYGFPEPAYEIEYPAPGLPELAQAVHKALDEKGVPSILDDQRGFDHGLFIPLKIMYPKADIPCVQLSLIRSLDPKAHIEMGQALANLEFDNLLVIGSGFSFHNMQAFFSPRTEETEQKNREFTQWLNDTCSDPDLDEKERTDLLINWEAGPSARYCHPREEHLLPLHVCYGLANRACTEFYELEIIGKKASVFLWQ